ncbi:response regulator [Candidatus Pacearchaeota archaeon]|nr:response regulator [Candidatus Pacearchaeota archaeon]
MKILDNLLSRKDKEPPKYANEGRGKRILVVEDERNLMRLIAEVHLKRRGYEVRCAYNGRDALREIEKQIPDLIITDLRMPIMSGEELVKNIKANPDQRINEIPIIMLTAKVSDSEVFKGWQAGCFAYLTKPYNPLELFRFMREAFHPSDMYDTEKTYEI